MKSLLLKVKTRQKVGKKSKDLKKNNQIPAVLYGHGIDNVNLTVFRQDFYKLYKDAGESTLVDLVIDGKEPVKILIQEVQRDPVTTEPTHIDFLQVKMTEKIETEIELEFVGVSPAVKDLAGVLVSSTDSLQVKCFPQDLVSRIEVDLSSLKTFEDHIYIKDLKVPEKIEVLDNPEEVVAGVMPPRSEEELKGLDEKPQEIKEATVFGEEKTANQATEAEVAKEKTKS